MYDERMIERDFNPPIVLDPAEETVILRLDSWGMASGRRVRPLENPTLRASRLVGRD